jgi:ribA/ribD-fused uncharacterized protein
VARNLFEDTDKKVVIDSFRNEFGFLSNFYETPVYLDGKRYASAEHAYQATKAEDPVDHEVIRKARTPGEAKKLGRAVKLPADWESKKLDVMRRVVREKFNNPMLAHALLETKDAELIEANTWGDKFFGICRGVGHNWLGKILMETRERLYKEAVADTLAPTKDDE